MKTEERPAENAIVLLSVKIIKSTMAGYIPPIPESAFLGTVPNSHHACSVITSNISIVNEHYILICMIFYSQVFCFRLSRYRV